MRSFTSGSGADTTATVKAHLLATRTPIIYTGIVIKPAKWTSLPQGGGVNFVSQYNLTDCPAAFNWDQVGTFAAANVEHGSIKSAIGTDFSDFDVSWVPQPTDYVLPTQVTLTSRAIPETPMSVISGIPHGFFDGAWVYVYKIVMPTFGDGNTYGAMLLSIGVVKKATLDGAKITFSVGSPFEQQNQQVPSQLIGPNSRFAAVDPLAYVGVRSFPGSSDAVCYFDWLATRGGPTTASKIESYNFGSAFVIPATGKFDGGFLVWTAGPLAGMRRGIRHSITDAVAWTVAFYLSEPYPFEQNQYSDGFLVGFPFEAYRLANPLSSGTDYNGFPYVPSPEDAL